MRRIYDRDSTYMALEKSVHSVQLVHMRRLRGTLAQAQLAVENLLRGYKLRGDEAVKVLAAATASFSGAPTDAERKAFEVVRRRSIGVEHDVLSEEGGAISGGEFARRLGLKSRQTVQNYRRSGRIFGLPSGMRNLVYPGWQIRNRTLLPGLADTLRVLHSRSTAPFSVALFFLTPAEALGNKRPLDLLRRGRTGEVVRHARRYGGIES